MREISRSLDIAKTISCTQYLWKTLYHKWFVFIECCKLGIPWLGIIHDWSKLTPGEWWPRGIGYGVRHDYPNVSQWFIDALDTARMHHQHRNKHHWERWLFMRNGDIITIAMPDKYRREMLAEWWGVEKEKGTDSTRWYVENRDKVRLHPETREWIEQRLGLRKRM